MQNISLALLWLGFLVIVLMGCDPDDDGAPLVTSNFSANETTIQEGSQVTFTDQSTGDPTGWAWSFVGGIPSSSTEQNPVVTYPTAGTYPVSLTASNADHNDTEEKGDYITVFTAIEAGFSVSDSVIAVGQSVVFTDESEGSPTSWNWTFEAGEPNTSTEQNPTVSYPTVGMYSVSLTASNGNDEDVEEKVAFIRVFEAISAEFSASDTTITSGTTVDFTDESTGGPTQWEWSFPGGTPDTSSDQNPSVTYNTPGTYPVTLTASNDDTTATIPKTEYITVNSSVDLMAGLMAYYPFNGNAEDASGNDNHGTIMGDPVLATDRKGVENSVYQMNGNDYISVPTSESLESVTTERTIASWIKVDQWYRTNLNWATIVAKGNTSLNSLQFNFLLGDIYVDGRPCEPISGQTFVELNTWEFVVLVSDSTSLKFYLNNEKILEAACTAAEIVNEQPMEIGRDVPSAIEYLIGSVDDLRIYNRALSEEEIEALYEE